MRKHVPRRHIPLVPQYSEKDLLGDKHPEWGGEERGTHTWFLLLLCMVSAGISIWIWYTFYQFIKPYVLHLLL